MRNLALFNLVSLDGYFAGPDGNINWHNVDEEFNEFAIQQIHAADLLVFGRETYQLMASYWPSPDAMMDDPVVAGLMNDIQKIVFSRTLRSTTWSNTRLVNSDAGEEMNRLKQAPGKDILIFGSANLASTFIQQGLIDEYRVMINPLLLGSGRPLFQRISGELPLKLVDTRTFRNGNVLLRYRNV